jgi:ketosteroid isomerase-like protein
MNAPAIALTRYVAYWESLTEQAVHDLARYYTEDAYFRDPFNEVRGLTAIADIFGEMFARLYEPRFRIMETVSEPASAFLVWDFTFRIKSFKPGVTRTIHGTTHVRFAADGRVSYHRDYWDAASELYEQLPLIGPVLRRLRRQFA